MDKLICFFLSFPAQKWGKFMKLFHFIVRSIDNWKVPTPATPSTWKHRNNHNEWIACRAMLSSKFDVYSLHSNSIGWNASDSKKGHVYSFISNGLKIQMFVDFGYKTGSMRSLTWLSYWVRFNDSLRGRVIKSCVCICTAWGKPFFLEWNAVWWHTKIDGRKYLVKRFIWTMTFFIHPSYPQTTTKTNSISKLKADTKLNPELCLYMYIVAAIAYSKNVNVNLGTN